MIGKAVEPVIEPLGFDWKLGIGLISGVGAKELVVSTLGVLYTNEEDVENVNLSNRIPITPLAALARIELIVSYILLKYAFDSSARCLALCNFTVDTSFIAFVICPVLSTLAFRLLISIIDAMTDHLTF